MNWLIAVGVVFVGFVIGSMVSAIVRKTVGNPSRSEKIRSLAEPVANLVMGLVLSLALVIALGIGDPESLKPLPKNIIAFVPKLITAALFIIAGSAISSLVGNAVSTSVLKTTGKPQPQLGRLVRSVLMGIFAILAVSQLGINTKIVDTVVAGIVFSLALSLALMTGFGSRTVAMNIAAGRYLKRIIQVGDVIETDSNAAMKSVSGTVVNVHGATVELGTTDGVVTIIHVPNAALLDSIIRIRRNATNDEPTLDAANSGDANSDDADSDAAEPTLPPSI
jgi:hypothetical protein